MSEKPLEPCPLGRQLVQALGLNQFVPITAQIGTEVLGANEHHIGPVSLGIPILGRGGGVDWEQTQALKEICQDP